MDLRADMVTQAADEVRANADLNSQQVSVQKLVKMETKQLEVLAIDTTICIMRERWVYCSHPKQGDHSKLGSVSSS